jgi:GT2 family glycosyltransferase
MVVRREVIARVGGFDEDFFMYGEDEEWRSRIKRAGWRIIYFPGGHRHSPSSLLFPSGTPRP